MNELADGEHRGERRGVLVSYPNADEPLEERLHPAAADVVRGQQSKHGIPKRLLARVLEELDELGLDAQFQQSLGDEDRQLIALFAQQPLYLGVQCKGTHHRRRATRRFAEDAGICVTVPAGSGCGPAAEQIARLPALALSIRQDPAVPRGHVDQRAAPFAWRQARDDAARSSALRE
jgi:hypothetical protein